MYQRRNAIPQSVAANQSSPPKKTAKKLLESLPKASNKQAVTDTAGDIAPPSVATIEKLHELATAKLAEIVRRSGSGEAGWDYDQSELISARELLDRDTQVVLK